MADNDERGMPLWTLTRLWLFGRYLYALGDVRLWTPIPHRLLGYTLAVVVPVWLAMQTLGIGFSGPGLTWHFVVPVAVVWWLLRMVSEGQRPREVIFSWARMGWHVARGHKTRPVRIRERHGRRG